MRGIDAERIEAADQVGGDRREHEQHHDDEADGAEHVALRQEGEPPPAMRAIARRRVAIRYRS